MIAWALAEAGEVPVDDAWLLPAEQATLASLLHPKRRNDWRLGRWVAKQVVGAVLGWPPAEVEIRADSDGVPYACRGGAPVAVALSISHRAGLGVAVVAVPALAIGCDVEVVESRAAVFEEDWFTPAERTLMDTATVDHDVLVTLIWSAKESALKALTTGLRRDTRTVVVDAIGDTNVEGWCGVHVRDVAGTGLEGWWRLEGGKVISVVGAAMPAPPVAVMPTPLVSR